MSMTQDPRLKTHVKALILDVMYRPVSERNTKKLLYLIRQNQVLQHVQCDAFSFKGVVYGDTRIMQRHTPKLHPDLHKDLLKMQEETEKRWNSERPKIENYITIVLNSSPSAWDWVSLLPEVFHTAIHSQLHNAVLAPAMLTTEVIAIMKMEHAEAIQLMKERMAINLILN